MASTTMSTRLTGQAQCLSSTRRMAASPLLPQRLVARRPLALPARAEKITRDKDQYMVEPEVDRSKVEQIEAGNISNENAEKRANIGDSRSPSLAEAQAFDGPAPETINGRLAMLGVVAALFAEFRTGEGVREQFAKTPISILSVFVIIALASYVPIVRGYTRKEPFANSVFNPKAENWNGRLAMIGFAGIILTEAFAGTSVVNFYSHLLGR